MQDDAGDEIRHNDIKKDKILFRTQVNHSYTHIQITREKINSKSSYQSFI